MTAELTAFVDIRATPERVWQVIADLPAYAEWNPFVTRAEGALVIGERLSVTVPPVNALMPSRLQPMVLEVTRDGGYGWAARWPAWAPWASSRSSTP